MTERLNEQGGFDVLSDVLETLRFRGSIFFQSDLAAPWGISLATSGIPRFHIVLSGECFVGSDEEDVLHVRPTDIVMLPNGHYHWIADRPGRQMVADSRAGEACELGNPLFQQGEITNRIMCGIVHYDQDSPHPILESLPRLLHFPKVGPMEPIGMTVQMIDAEVRRVKSNRSPILDRMTEVLFLQLLNHYVDNTADSSGFLVALRDRRLRRALELIHLQPEANWTLASLGEQVGMSRATLVRRFEDAIGVAPMRYIGNWRLLKAHNLVRYTAEPLEQIAEKTGFASARTLGKAFLRQYAMTPSSLRRKTRNLN
ncbi:MAG TPA: AraC family transcriptional regulator [Woeseiaceae bacterium]|nr:AraC family transcriptional regulator [Woeseiaceae bacterium]